MPNRLQRLLVAAGTHPIINGIAAVVSVMAGALASFFTGSIRGSLGLPTDPSSGNEFALTNLHWSPEAYGFWLMIIAAACLFAWSKYSDSATDNEHKGYVSKALKGLESMPPDAFLNKLFDEYTRAHETVASIQAFALAGRPPLTIQAIDEAINKVLTSIAHVASAYDGNVEREYRVYLMLYSREKWNEAKLSQALNFAYLSRAAYVGTLESFKSLCIVKNFGSSVVEPRIGKIEQDDEFAFPIHRPENKTNPNNVLPGGPQAFVDGIYKCESVQALLKDLSETLLDRNQVPAIKKFYEERSGKGVKSFVSLAVPANKGGHSTVDLAGSVIAGVVNIEANAVNILKSESLFLRPVTQPFLLMISDLLSIRNSVISSTP